MAGSEMALPFLLTFDLLSKFKVHETCTCQNGSKTINLTIALGLPEVIFKYCINTISWRSGKVN